MLVLVIFCLTPGAALAGDAFRAAGRLAAAFFLAFAAGRFAATFFLVFAAGRLAAAFLADAFRAGAFLAAAFFLAGALRFAGAFFLAIRFPFAFEESELKICRYGAR
jgi:hypothetical protein